MDHTKKSKYISFRVTEEQAIEIEMAALDAGIKPREWCRNVVLEKLGSDPCRRVKRFREDNERNRYLSDQEEARLLSVLTGPRADLRPVVILRFTQVCDAVNY